MQKEGRFVLKPVDLSAPLPPVLAIRPDNLKPEEKPKNSEKHPVGTLLILKGLKAQAQFNGHGVVVSGFLFDQNRYKVRPEDPNSPLPPTLAIKPENLVPYATTRRPGLQKSLSSRSGVFSSSGQARRGTMGVEQSNEITHNHSKQGAMIRRNSCPRISINDSKVESHKIGGKYQLEGLRSVPHFNGQIVTIKAFLGDEGRYQVVPEDPNGPLPPHFAVKPANLIAVAEDLPQENAAASSMTASFFNLVKSYSQKSLVIPGDQNDEEAGKESSINPGDTMKIVDLQSRPEWNGQTVIVQHFVPEQGRYQVAPLIRVLDMPETMLLKPKNLEMAQQSTVPKNIEVPQSDDVSTLASEYSYQPNFSPKSTAKIYSVGSEVIIQRSMEPALEGLKFRVTEVFEKTLEYKLEPVGPDSMDACRGGEVTIAHDDLTPANKLDKEIPEEGEEEEEESEDVLPPGHRGVIQGYSASLNGHLVKVVCYNPRRKTYLVEPLGRLARKSVGTSAISLAPQNIMSAPPAAFWTTVNKKGKRMYVPCHAIVHKTKSGQNAFTAYISCFPGVDKVAPLARALLGEDKCDWDNLKEVKEVLQKSASNSIAVDVKDKEARRLIGQDEIVLKPNKHANTIDALIEYELIEKTDRTVEVQHYGTLPVYKIIYNYSDTHKSCDHSEASPTTVVSSAHTEHTEPRSNTKPLEKTFSVTLLESEGMDDSVHAPLKNDRSSRRLKSDRSDRKLGRRSSSKRLSRRCPSSSSSLSCSLHSEFLELQTAIAEGEAEKKKLEAELQALREAIKRERAAAATTMD